MGELRQEFLNQTISNLKQLQKESFEDEILSEDFLRRFFRQLHTIKGTSKAFNLHDLARLAHEIENLLQAVQSNQILQNAETKIFFTEAFKHLLEITEVYQANEKTVFPQDFSDKLKKLLPDSEKNNSVDFPSLQIPESILSQLAEPEKNNLNLAIQKGKNFYLMQALFEVATFYEDFKNFKQILSEQGEVIAILPSETNKTLEEFAFQIFFVSSLNKNAVEKLVRSLAMRVEFENDSQDENYSDDLEGIVKMIIAEGERTASFLNKKVSFKTELDEIKLSNKNLLLLQEVASHLFNNAIDHAIESGEERIKQGKNPIATVKISITKSDNNLILEIEDDGRGIDFERIREKAGEQGFVKSDQILDEKELLEITFQPGFSTGETVSEISGRGVGLDAVNDLIEKAGGKIEVQTTIGKGTNFRIYLPN